MGKFNQHHPKIAHSQPRPFFSIIVREKNLIDLCLLIWPICNLTDHVSIIRTWSDIFSRWYLENICGQQSHTSDGSEISSSVLSKLTDTSTNIFHHNSKEVQHRVQFVLHTRLGQGVLRQLKHLYEVYNYI